MTEEDKSAVEKSLSSDDKKVIVADLEQPSPTPSQYDSEEHHVYTAAEKALLRKLDIRIMPILFISYLLAIIDRSNVSFAKIANQEIKHDMLSITGSTDEQFSIALAAFFVGYIAFEIPSNLVMKKIPAPAWISRIMITWGIVTTCQILVNAPWQFSLCRFLLGVFEAGFFPGIVYYLTFWYRKREAAQRVAGFYVATTVSGVVGSAWSYGCQLIDTQLGYYGWQWIFLTSGVPTIFVGIIVAFILPNTPETANGNRIKWNWLSEDEIKLASERLRADKIAKAESVISKKEVIGSLLDYKNYLFVVLYFGTVMSANALGLFLPTILVILGYKSLDATRMSIGPYAAGAVATLAVAYLSDRMRNRSFPLIGSAFVGMVGWIILATTAYNAQVAKYIGLIVSVAGVFSAIPLIFSWLSNNQKTSTEGATAIAMVSALGNFGSIVASYTMYKNDKPGYVPSHTGNAVGMGVTVLFTIALYFNYTQLNKKARKADPESGKTSTFVYSL